MCFSDYYIYWLSVYLLRNTVFIRWNQSDLQGHVSDINDVKALTSTLITMPYERKYQ